MLAARIRTSIKHFFHGKHHHSSISSLIPNRILLYRFNGGELLSRNRIKHFFSSFHISSESVVGAKPHTTGLFTSLEEDVFTELGCIQKDQSMVLQLLTTKTEPIQVENPETSQITKTKKMKKKKKKKNAQASDSVSKLHLLTEKPEVSWKTKREKAKANASSPEGNGTYSNVPNSKPSMSPSPIRDAKSEAQNIISSSSEAENETSSKSSSPSRNVTDSKSEAKKETSSKGSSKSSTTANNPSSVVIRISNLNSITTDQMIHAMCLSIGYLQGLTRVNENTVDVLFRSRNMKEADSILEELNDANVDHSKWLAEIAIAPEPEEVSRDQASLRIGSCCEDWEMQLTMRHILVKDLELLMHSVVHLENHPLARQETKALVEA